MSTLTWLHVSDLHFCMSGVRKYNAEVVLSELLKDVKELMAEKGLKPDLVFCTGDIAFSSQEDEYKLARNFFDQLLKAIGHPGEKERLFLVPGNHDVNWDFITRTAEKRAESLDNRDAVTQTLLSPDSCRLFLCRLDGYASFINNYFPKEHLAFDDEHYFYVCSFDVGRGTEKIRIAALGLNSAWVAHGNDEDLVVVGEIQAKKALDDPIVKSAHIRIALLHHPFERLRNFDREDVERLLGQGCDFILVGHRHKQTFQRSQVFDRDFVLIPAGAAYEGREKTEINAYNLICLDLAAGVGTIYLREYSHRAGRFVEDYRTFGKSTHTFDLPNRVKRHGAIGRIKEPARVTLILDGVDSFGTDEQTRLLMLLASALQIGREQIRIVSVLQGNVRVELELPAEAAATLETLIRSGRLNLASLMRQVIPPESTPSGRYTINITNAQGISIGGVQVVQYEPRVAPSLISIYLTKGIAIVLEASVVKVIAQRVEPLFNRETELELFQQILLGESPLRGVVVHSRGERGWGKSSLLMMLCQECSKCDPRFTQAFLFLNQEAPVDWESILDITARRLGLAHFPKPAFDIEQMVA